MKLSTLASLAILAPITLSAATGAGVLEARRSAALTHWATHGRLEDVKWSARAHDSVIDPRSRWRVLQELKGKAKLALFGRLLKDVPIRMGYLEENRQVPFRGNVLYMQGLGDSMLNHDALFSELTQAGYRVIAFDYMGQGGSQGQMWLTNMGGIPRLADVAWERYARIEPTHSAARRKILLGWSTGGLAAYRSAYLDPAVRAVVMIAPGIAPRLFVGETRPLQGQFLQITEASLTRGQFTPETNPHLEPAHPDSPIKAAPFAINLLFAGHQSKSWKISPEVQGLCLLSDEKDSYVNATDTRRILSANAPQFEVTQYADALHEIDNEVPATAQAARDRILSFLDKLP